MLGFNQRDVAGILAMIRSLGADRLQGEAEARRGRPRPRVYFEEWDEPMISGIGWLSELVAIAGARMCSRLWPGKNRRATGSSAPIR